MHGLENELAFRVVLALVLVGFIGHRAYYHRKLARSPEAAVEAADLGRLSRAASFLGVPALLSTAAYIIQPVWLAWASFALPAWARWLGVPVALGGFALLQASHQALGRNWSDEPRLFEEHELVARGPYRWIRHPIYAAFLLILGSPLLLSANLLVGLSWIGMTALDVAARIKVEEALLLSQFGDAYRGYMLRTGRLLPRVAPSNGNNA